MVILNLRSMMLMVVDKRGIFSTILLYSTYTN